MPPSLLSGWKIKDLYLATVLFVTVQCLNNIKQGGLAAQNSIFNDPPALVDQQHRRLRKVFQEVQRPQKALKQAATTGTGASESGDSGTVATGKWQDRYQQSIVRKGQDPMAYQDLRWAKLHPKDEPGPPMLDGPMQETIQSASTPEDTKVRNSNLREEAIQLNQEEERGSRRYHDRPASDTKQYAKAPEDKTMIREIDEEEEITEEVFLCDANNTICCAALDAPESAIDDWWTHHPDWEELPLQDATSAKEVCFRPMPLAKMATFFRQLYAMQYAGGLCDQDLQVWQINAGYGASLNQIVRGLWTAHNQGRPFQMTKHWPGARWLYSTNLTSQWNYCPTTDMNCYFLPLGACPPVYRRNDDYAQAATNTKDEKQRFKWTRQYVGRVRHRVRKRLVQALQQPSLPPLESLENNCTVMHVRRGDVGYPRHPFRRYAAVQEYLDIGNLTKGETIVLLTDDETTIQEVQEWHSKDYNWVWMDRPRNHGINNGMDGHIPSHDEGAEIVAILAEVRLASQCHKIVHGHSGFVTTIKDELEAVGRNYTSVFLDTKLSHQEMKEWRQKYNPSGRADSMISEIRERYRNQTATANNNQSVEEEQAKGEDVGSEAEPAKIPYVVTQQVKAAVDQPTPPSMSKQKVQEQESPLLPAAEDKEEPSNASFDPAKRLEEEIRQAIQEGNAASNTDEEDEEEEQRELATVTEADSPAEGLEEFAQNAMQQVPSISSSTSNPKAQDPSYLAEKKEEPSGASVDPAKRLEEEMKQAIQEKPLASSSTEGDEESVRRPEVRARGERKSRKTNIGKAVRKGAARVTPRASAATQQQRERIAKMKELAKKKLEELNHGVPRTY